MKAEDVHAEAECGSPGPDISIGGVATEKTWDTVGRAGLARYTQVAVRCGCRCRRRPQSVDRVGDSFAGRG